MQTQYSRQSQNSGKIKAPQIFLMLVGLIGLGAVGTYTVNAIRESKRLAAEDRNTQILCRTWAVKILAEAKTSPPETGRYEATLPVNDSWEQPLASTLIVEELENNVRVYSLGRDMIASDDDHEAFKRDVHVRKSILKGIVAGSHSAGKGLTSGVIEGLGEAKDSSLAKAKAGVSKVKTSLMSRFKRKGSDEPISSSQTDD